MGGRGRSEESALNETQLKKLWGACSEPTDKVLVGLCAFAGLRVGEAIHLNASWIKEGCIVIPSSMPCNCWECHTRGGWKPKTKAMKLQCPNCKSKYVLYNKSTNSWWCRKCGVVFDKTGKIISRP